jgi:UDP-glucose 4-epimerase
MLTGPVNIGHGRETSLLDLIEALREAGAERGLTLQEPEFQAARPGEVARSCLDVNRARDELGWTPEVALTEGLRRILATLR